VRAGRSSDFDLAAGIKCIASSTIGLGSTILECRSSRRDAQLRSIAFSS
jgi:hypothetical protein